MMSLWVGVALLSLLALGFIFWPLVRFGKQQNGQSNEVVADRLAENVRLFREHVAELEAQLAAGRIDQAQFDQLKVEQERALLDDEADIRAAQQNRTLGAGLKTLSLIAVVVVAASFVLYEHLGSSADVEIRLAQEIKQELDNKDYQAGRNPDPVRAREMVRLIQARLADDPEQLQYWFFLARTQMDLNDFAQAVTAYEQLRQYGAVPQPGDSARALVTKLQTLEKGMRDDLSNEQRVFPDLLIASQRAGLVPVTGATVASVRAPETVKTGEVVDGYKFKGGDPSDQNNWEKVAQ